MSTANTVSRQNTAENPENAQSQYDAWKIDLRERCRRVKGLLEGLPPDFQKNLLASMIINHVDDDKIDDYIMAKFKYWKNIRHGIIDEVPEAQAEDEAVEKILERYHVDIGWYCIDEMFSDIRRYIGKRNYKNAG
jgi:hypothetical protein